MRGNHKAVVQVLLMKDSDVTLRNRLGLNANRLAAKLGHKDIAEMLPTSKQLVLRKIRTAGRLCAMVGSSRGSKMSLLASMRDASQS